MKSSFYGCHRRQTQLDQGCMSVIADWQLEMDADIGRGKYGQIPPQHSIRNSFMMDQIETGDLSTS